MHVHAWASLLASENRDIAAANASEATSIGIASSAFSMRQLSEAGAMQVYPNLKPTTQLLAGLGCFDLGCLQSARIL